ncbi:MAG: peptidoglycan-binding domain-containing protein [Candidatus Excrementavichristensenella sp.]|jgi:peptidoglycan hydrolase-like protein with peptidoglycan-binding domain
MSTVMIGSARIDERGRARGGRAGDQGGKEVSLQAWYRHAKGWVLLRCVDPAMRGYIGDAMEAACKNEKIGYDQGQRLTLYNQVKDKGFDPAKAAVACETDCSALVRVCVLYAFGKCGIAQGVPNFTTGNQVSALVGTGHFEKLTAPEYTAKPGALTRGDILVTRVRGHTVVVVRARPTLRYGATGETVRRMQTLLLRADPASLPVYGADGQFGGETRRALRRFQKKAGLRAMGICGPRTWEALERAGKEG